MADLRLTIMEGPNQGRNFDLAGSLVVGRDTSAGIVLEDPEASRRHASISAQAGAATIEDLGSTNGTFVNGERIEGQRTLSAGDRIRIGTTVLEFQGAARETQAGAGVIADPEATRMGAARPSAPPEGPTEVQPPEAAPPAPEPGPPPAPEPVGGPPAPEPGPPPPPEPIGAPPAPEPGPPPAPEPGPPPAPEPVGGPPAPEPGPPPPPEPIGAPPAAGPGAPPPPPGAAPPAPGPGAPPAAPPGPPGMAPPPGAGPPVAYQQADFAGRPDYPMDVQADYPHNGIARWRAFFQGLLAFPHFFLIFIYAIGLWFYLLVAFFTVLFTGRYPPNAFRFVAGVMTYAQRLTGYVNLMTEAYPPFDTQEHPEYPIRTRIPYPPDGRITNWRPLISGLLAFPHAFVLFFVQIGAAFALIGAWFSILFTKRYPPGIFSFVLGSMRWSLRTYAYAYFMTEQYPPFSLE